MRILGRESEAVPKSQMVDDVDFNVYSGCDRSCLILRMKLPGNLKMVAANVPVVRHIPETMISQ